MSRIMQRKISKKEMVSDKDKLISAVSDKTEKERFFKANL